MSKAYDEYQVQQAQERIQQQKAELNKNFNSS